MTYSALKKLSYIDTGGFSTQTVLDCMSVTSCADIARQEGIVTIVRLQHGLSRAGYWSEGVKSISCELQCVQCIPSQNMVNLSSIQLNFELKLW